MPQLKFDLSDAPDDPGVTFQSTWRLDVAVYDAEAQTDELEVVHQKTQFPKTEAIEIQTDAASDVTTQPLVRSGFQKLRELDSFLEHCTPLLEALTSEAADLGQTPPPREYVGYADALEYALDIFAALPPCRANLAVLLVKRESVNETNQLIHIPPQREIIHELSTYDALGIDQECRS